MGTLSSELAPHVERLSDQPRVYVDANVPAGIVGYMRARLQWDTVFVIEHEDLRRAPDAEHYRLARQLRRTLITCDRDYLDDRRFPMNESGGVLVLTAPDERGLIALLTRLDKEVLRSPADAAEGAALPLAGRKLHLHTDWAPPAPGPGQGSR
jgi:hypothetical protein